MTGIPLGHTECFRSASQAILPLVYVFVGGFFLGLMSFAGDVAPGIAGKIILAVFSTGSTWCLLSALAGYQYKRRSHSSTAAVGILLMAVVTYYGTIVLSGVRFGGKTRSGSTLSSVDWLGEVASMAAGVGVWTAASAAAGLVMGQLGYLVRNGGRAWRSVAVGMTFGIAVGPVVSDLAFILRFGVNPATSQLILPAACAMLVACLALVLALAVRRRVSWPLLIASSSLSCIGVALAWGAVNEFRSSL